MGKIKGRVVFALNTSHIFENNFKKKKKKNWDRKGKGIESKKVYRHSLKDVHQTGYSSSICVSIICTTMSLLFVILINSVLGYFSYNILDTSSILFMHLNIFLDICSCTSFHFSHIRLVAGGNVGSH